MQKAIALLANPEVRTRLANRLPAKHRTDRHRHSAGASSVGRPTGTGPIRRRSGGCRCRGWPGPAAFSRQPAPARPVAASSAPASPPRTQTSTNLPPPAPQSVISSLSVASREVSDAQAGKPLRALVRRTANGSGWVIADAVTRNGFWIGSSRALIRVQPVGPLRTLRIRAGDQVGRAAVPSASTPSPQLAPESPPGLPSAVPALYRADDEVSFMPWAWTLSKY